MKKHFNLRNLGLIGGSLLVLGANYAMDPDGHVAKLAVYLGNLALPITAVWFAYLARKVVMPYVSLQAMVEKAKNTATGAGLIFLGTCLVMFGLLGLFGTQARASTPSTAVELYIPKNAEQHLHTLIDIQDKEWPDHPKKNYSRL